MLCCSQDHLKQLAERERGRFQAEYKKLQTESSELQDKVNSVQSAVFKGNERMDQFKVQMNWNQEELEQWALAARQKEEDNLAILKYTKVCSRPIMILSMPFYYSIHPVSCMTSNVGGRSQDEGSVVATRENAGRRAEEEGRT